VCSVQRGVCHWRGFARVAACRSAASCAKDRLDLCGQCGFLRYRQVQTFAVQLVRVIPRQVVHVVAAMAGHVAIRYGKFAIGKSHATTAKCDGREEDKLKPDLQKKLEELKQTVAMLIEAQAIRAKKGQPEPGDLNQGMSLLRVQLHTLEKAVYGSSIAAMKARTENLERALNRQGTQQ
jgi:hypothetical protein